MSEEKRVVHELKLSKPVLFLLWFVAIGMVGKPVGTMVFPEAMAEINNGSKLKIDIQHSGGVTVY